MDVYRDAAIGTMGKNGQGKLAITTITLYPEIRFGGVNQPGDGQIIAMHHEAHEECFIASSVKTDVRCEPLLGKR